VATGVVEKGTETDVGILMPFASDSWEGISDSQVYAEELGLVRLADELGFNVA
jgi:hypothetical protein